MEQRAMTSARIDALVASAFNLAAADKPSLRVMHQGGMSPAVAAALPKEVKIGWIESYLLRLHKGELAKHEPLLYGVTDAVAALHNLSGRAV